MAELSGKSAKIRTTSILGTSSTDNAATISTGGGTGNSSIQIDATGRRHWDRASTAEPSLWLNSTLVPATAVSSINYVQGKFELNESRSSTGVYTIDCIFLTSSYLAGGKAWNADVTVGMYDTTTFSTTTGDASWRTFIPGLSEASATIERLFQSTAGSTENPLFYDRLNLQAPLVVELITNDANRFEGYGFIASNGVTAGVDTLTVESVDIQIDGPLYYSTT
jgi:hypothetical protein